MLDGQNQGPHSHILMTGEGSDRGSYFIPKKITTSESVSTHKSHYFFSIPKKFPWSFFRNPKKSLCFFSRPKKIPASFIHPKTSLLAKISDPKTSLGPSPPVIKICEWGPWVGKLVTQQTNLYTSKALTAQGT